MKKILLASSNQGKIDEYRDLLRGLPIEVISAADLNLEPPEETGTTLEENALLKARAYHAASGLPTISDDGGFEIDALGGSPGIYGKRWVNGTEDVTDEEIIAHTLKQLEGVTLERRTARMPLAIAYIDLAGGEHVASAYIEGRVALLPKDYIPRFPYRAIFFVTKFGKMYGELSPEEHAVIGHRQLAFQKLLPVIKQTLL